MFSKRIECLINFASDSTSIADIGSDHGYLLIGLAKLKQGIDLLGVENKLGPFLQLNKNIRLNGLKDRIKTSLSNGLVEVPDTYKTIVLAGMGFNNIKKIIDNSIDKIKNIDEFIIDSHTNLYEIRKYFNNLGYKIIKEKIIYEDNIFYCVIKFKKGYEVLKEEELEYGPIVLKEFDDVAKKYFENALNHINLILNKIGISAEKREALIKQKAYLEKLLGKIS